jgi:peptidoglycan/xylan/chitin deacetylase (PgdA/CDA1 family)
MSKKLNPTKTGVDFQQVVRPAPCTGRNVVIINSVELNILLGKGMKKRLRRLLIVVGAIVLCVVLFPFVAPRIAGSVRSDIVFRIPSEQKTIYLTVDDSPTEGTPAILEVLKRHDVRATFFIVSGRVRSPEQIAAILADGHTLGHHMVSTRAGWKLSYDEFVRDFDQCADVLRSHGEVGFFRPPSGYATKAEVAYVRSKGMQAILGSAYPFDTSIEHVGTLVRLASWLSVNGGIIILHDGKDRGDQTAEVLDRLIPILKSRGYRIEELKTTKPPNQALQTTSVTRSGFGKVPVCDRQRRGV